MSENTPDAVIEPVSASASGRFNAFSVRCQALGFTNLYAGCLARLGALDAPGVKVPADWNDCRSTRSAGRCEAARMREEELLKGKAIYFQPRSVPGEAPKTAWVSTPTRHTAAAPSPKAAKVGSISSMGSAGVISYGDLVNAMVREELKSASAPARSPAAPPATPSATPIQVRADESPLEAIRRMQRERAATSPQPQEATT